MHQISLLSIQIIIETLPLKSHPQFGAKGKERPLSIVQSNSYLGNRGLCLYTCLKVGWFVIQQDYTRTGWAGGWLGRKPTESGAEPDEVCGSKKFNFRRIWRLAQVSPDDKLHGLHKAQYWGVKRVNIYGGDGFWLVKNKSWKWSKPRVTCVKFLHVLMEPLWEDRTSQNSWWFIEISSCFWGQKNWQDKAISR